MTDLVEVELERTVRGGREDGGGIRHWRPRRGPVDSSRGSDTFGYDALGRLVDYDGTASYAWDGLDRLASRSGVAFSYPGTGIDPASDGTTLYSLSPEGDPLAVSDGAGARLALQDRHGDLGVLFGLGGDVSATRAYDPFGAVAGTTGAAGAWPAAGYQSDYTDPASGKVWMGSRWYDPTAGAFVSRDTWSGQLRTPIALGTAGMLKRIPGVGGRSAGSQRECPKNSGRDHEVRSGLRPPGS